MSTFNYEQFNSQTQSSDNAGDSVKIGFFKLAKDGDEALVRMKISSVDDMFFATTHKPIFGKKWEGLSNPYAGISCLNEYGQYSDNCPFCRAAAEGHPVIDKAKKLVFVPMLVSYKDRTTGTWSAPQPVVWERPAGFAREVANKLKDYGDLTQILLKITKMGKGTDTRYALDYAMPAVFKPEMIPADFSAFSNFKIDRHSYWVKTAAELEGYINSGSFAEPDKKVTEATSVYKAPTPVAPVAQSTSTVQSPINTVYTVPVQAPVVDPAPVVNPTPAVPVTSSQVEEKPAAQPTRSFNGFSF